ncbi:hypothetical protein IWW34DRAFT_321980 [Fusarium oxysporum f. sp. albedinis]|uniref:uncharacterized protein n=1 Tax=Fusarium oxysporum Fo47 TaxID=660027 RepID=UPI002869AF4D|nr:uncharacterized protein FOBCDRAFT_261974 [Fusarium oxysporum Fo47]KAI3583412.1 hypothetical protein IWW34DRAFT_321980 [Fusarium oxysporum f. sp. albedinis]KAJ0152493.1 hypothetical protein HZ326_5048 [Fusarium oxysporum f. sp. albedinis]WJG35547.1 hypothetical protein FOBCDRAFT_261974 [Fusarium oxysporum Fo47]
MLLKPATCWPWLALAQGTTQAPFWNGKWETPSFLLNSSGVDWLSKARPAARMWALEHLQRFVATQCPAALPPTTHSLRGIRSGTLALVSQAQVQHRRDTFPDDKMFPV